MLVSICDTHKLLSSGNLVEYICCHLVSSVKVEYTYLIKKIQIVTTEIVYYT